MTETAADPDRNIDSNEVNRFNALAARWWDETGPMRPLHRINATRLAFLRDELVRHFKRDPQAVRPFEGLTLLDLGCGCGLVAEPMTRMGFSVTAVDAAEKNVAAAQTHAVEARLAIDYRHATAEDLAASSEAYDVVLALEIVEHVVDPSAFVTLVSQLVRPGGVLALSTLNRTVRSFAVGIVAAEYVLGMLPRGTHRWSRFVKPSELAAGVRSAGLAVTALAGMSYQPLRDEWRIGRDVGVNYLMLAVASPPA